MAKASKKRGKKKSAKRKSPARRSSRKKAAAKRKSSAKKAVRRRSAKRKVAKRKTAKRMPANNQDTPWPVLFAVVLAFLGGLAAVWYFSDFSMAANAATIPAISSIVGAPISMGAAYVGCEIVEAADTWLALMHADLVPGAF